MLSIVSSKSCITMNTSQEKFFTRKEYEQRIGRVHAAMNKAGIDVLITTHPSHVCYLTGHFTQAVNDLMVLVLPAGDRPILQLPFFERPRHTASGIGIEDVDNWAIGQDPATHVVGDIKKRKLDQGIIALDVAGIYTPYSFTHELIENLNARTVTTLIDQVRMIKSPSEHAYLREAAVITDIGTQAAIDAFSEGAVDYDVAATAHAAMIKAGCESLTCDPYICIGWRTAAPHSNRGGHVASIEDPLFVELGATRARYTAPLMRSAVAGRTTPELTELAAVSNEVIEAVCSSARGGITASEVAAKGEAAIESLLPKILWHHNYGYPVGVGFAPAWIDCPHFLINADNHLPLIPGMVFHLPTQLRVDGRHGAGFSETIIITETGCEQLSQLPRNLVVR